MIYFLLFFSLLTSCAVKYRIDSKPTAAKIFAGTKELGVAPLDVDIGQLGEEVAGGYILRVEKRGYRNVWIWLPKASQAYSLLLNLNPLYQSLNKEESKSKLVFSEVKRTDMFKLSALLMDQQGLLLSSEKADAKIIENLLEVNPTLGSVNFLAALLRLSEDKKEEAITLLRDAVRYAPREEDFLAILNELEGEKVGEKK